MSRLAELQKAVRVAKDKRNDFGKYNYRTAEGILAAAKPHLRDTEAIVPSDTLQEVAGQIFVTATVTLYIDDKAVAHAQGHAMHALEKKGMDPSQISGSASSYARKYALQGLFAIDDASQDPDGQDNRHSSKDALSDARKDAEAESTPKERAAIFKEECIRKFKSLRSEGGLSKAWDEKKTHLDRLQEVWPEMFTEVVDVYETRMNELTEKEMAQ